MRTPSDRCASIWRLSMRPHSGVLAVETASSLCERANRSAWWNTLFMSYLPVKVTGGARWPRRT